MNGLASDRALDIASFDHAVEQVDPDIAYATVDLRRLEFIDTYGLVGMACLLHGLHESGFRTELTPPDSIDVQYYLARMHLQQVLDACEVDLVTGLPSVREHAGPDQLIELTQFQGEYECEQLAGLLWDRLHGHADGHTVEALYVAVLELGANVGEHSLSPVGGFMAAQVFLRGTQGEYVVAAVGDIGIGMRQSLADRYHPADDIEAVRLALRADVSGLADPGRGQGLPTVVGLSTSLRGYVRVRSGSGVVTIFPSAAPADTVSPIMGTLLGARIPCRP